MRAFEVMVEVVCLAAWAASSIMELFLFCISLPVVEVVVGVCVKLVMTIQTSPGVVANNKL